jgi:hypothetical protein
MGDQAKENDMGLVHGMYRSEICTRFCCVNLKEWRCEDSIGIDIKKGWEGVE